MSHPLTEAYDHYTKSVELSRNIKSSARKAFGKELRAARITLGMSVRELGDHIGITGSLINQVEMTGKSVLKRNVIERIVELCYNAKNHLKPEKVLANPESVSKPSAVNDLN